MHCRKTCPPELQPLEQRLLLSGVSDLLDWATDLAVTTPAEMALRGSIEQPRQPDLFQFTAEATSKLVVDMLADGGLLDPCLRLYRLSGDRLRKVSRNNNAQRGTADSRLTYTLEPGETYVLCAQGQGKSTGPYRLVIQTELDDDHGDTLQEATPMSLSRSGSARQYGSIDYGDDVDVLGFAATRTGQMRITQTSRRSRQPVTCLLTVYDQDGQVLLASQPRAGQGNSAVAVDVVAGRRYYVSLAGSDGDVGDYVVAIATRRGQVPAPRPPTPPPNPAPPPAPDSPVDVAPGSEVSVYQRSAGAGLQLLVLGTDRADTIVVTQTADGIAVAAGGASTGTYAGVFSAIVVYGFAGNDVIRLANSVTAPEVIDAGPGNDSVFTSAMGSGSIRGGDGDDLIVAIGGSADSVRGDGGLDSFWVDASDAVADTSSAEYVGTNVHVVRQFYQPYTTVPGASGYVPLDIAGQDLTDPAATSYAAGYANFASRPLFNGGPGYRDIQQGSVGDCYLLASLASLAQSDPALVEQVIAPLGDGTFAVRFYVGNDPVYVRVDADLPVRAGGALAYAGLGPGGELWVPLVEKAYAYFRYGMNSYASLHGGWMADTFTHLTARANVSRSTSGLGAGLYTFFDTQLRAGHPVTLGSQYSASGPVVAGHAYMVQSVYTDQNGQQFVTVYNPWGYDGRRWDANYYDGLVTLSTAQVLQYFSAAVVSNV